MNRHTPCTLAAALVRWRLSHLHLRFPATWQRHDAKRLKELEKSR